MYLQCDHLTTVWNGRGEACRQPLRFRQSAGTPYTSNFADCATAAFAGDGNKKIPVFCTGIFTI